jgi:hypothetical protein
MALLVSYADESGMHTNGEYSWVVLAGYLASEAQWKPFNRDWSIALKKCGLDNGFHMTEFQDASTPPYCEWSDTEKEENLELFVRVIEKYKFSGFVFQTVMERLLVIALRAGQKKGGQAPLHRSFRLRDKNDT